jgi:hypothetical protein
MWPTSAHYIGAVFHVWMGYLRHIPWRNEIVEIFLRTAGSPQLAACAPTDLQNLLLRVDVFVTVMDQRLDIASKWTLFTRRQ